MNQLVPAALRPEFAVSPMPAARVETPARTQARVSSEVRWLCGGVGARRIFAARVSNVGREAWNETAATHALRCRLFSWTREFLQVLPSRRLPRVAPGATVSVAIDLVLPLVAGRYALSLDVVEQRSDDVRSPLLVPVDVLPERESGWNPRGLVDEAFRTFTGQPCEERAREWWARRLADGAPVEAFFASFEEVAAARYPERRGALIERIGVFAPCGQHAQAVTD